MRGFSWRRAQQHRSDLQFLVSTGRHRESESLEEARLLVVLGFAAAVGVLSSRRRALPDRLDLRPALPTAEQSHTDSAMAWNTFASGCLQ